MQNLTGRFQRRCEQNESIVFAVQQNERKERDGYLC